MEHTFLSSDFDRTKSHRKSKTPPLMSSNPFSFPTGGGATEINSSEHDASRELDNARVSLLSLDSDEEAVSSRPSLRRCKTCDNGAWTMTKESTHLSHSRPSIVKRNSFYDPYRQFKIHIRLSDLEELEEVGQGFFGRVIKVRHKSSQSIYVMKEVLDHTADNMESVLKEVVTLRALKHPNVLHCIGVAVKDRSLCLVSEYIDGGPLHKIIADPSMELSWTLRSCYARDIAAGMEYLHYNSIVHRDLNSPNCLVRKANSVVVADFGLSIFLQKEDISQQMVLEHSKINRVPQKPKVRLPAVGNPYGMAPEMLAGQNYDDKVDLYSFGVIICELMTRLSSNPDDLPRDPCTLAVDISTLLANHLIQPNCPKEFLTIATKCCQADPNVRPSFHECHSVLESLVFHLETRTSRPKELDRLA